MSDKERRALRIAVVVFMALIVLVQWWTLDARRDLRECEQELNLTVPVRWVEANCDLACPPCECEQAREIAHQDHQALLHCDVWIGPDAAGNPMTHTTSEECAKAMARPPCECEVEP